MTRTKTGRKVIVFQVRTLKNYFLARIDFPIDLMKKYHPNIAGVEMGLNHFNANLMAHFWKIHKSKLNQTSLDSFFKRPSADEPVTELQFSKKTKNNNSFSSFSS